jgi:hypothetical protein
MWVATLALLGLFSAASAGAVTITIAGAIRGITFSPPPGNVAMAVAEPYCPATTFGIRGTGFLADGGVVSVSIGNVPAKSFTVSSDNLMFAQLNVGATSGPIVVTTGAGSFSTDSLPGGRLFQSPSHDPRGLLPGVQIVPCPIPPKVAKAVVTSIAPKRTAGGKHVLLTGSGLYHVTKVTVGGKVAVFSASSDTKVILTVPRRAAMGELTVVLTNPAGVTTSKVKLIKTGAWLAEIRPNSASAGHSVWMRGYGFSSVTKITVGGEPAEFVRWSDEEIMVTVPEAARSGPLSIVFTYRWGGTTTVTTGTVKLVKTG